MEVIRRCFGCGRCIWPWQDVIVIKNAGCIHNTPDCILKSYYKHFGADDNPDFLYEVALAKLNQIYAAFKRKGW